MVRVCVSRVGLAATGLPPRPSPDPGVGTRIALVHGAMGIRDNYISFARRCRRVRTLLATQRCTRGVVCDTAALGWKLPPWPQHTTLAPLLRSRPALSSRSPRTLSLSQRALPYCSSLVLLINRQKRSTASCHHTSQYFTDGHASLACRKIDHAALPLPRPPSIQATRYGMGCAMGGPQWAQYFQSTLEARKRHVLR
jgi:hypothetical protein